MKGVDLERKTTKAEAFRRAAFDEYLKQGGFPELMAIEDGRAYVSGLVEQDGHRMVVKPVYEWCGEMGITGWM